METTTTMAVGANGELKSKAVNPFASAKKKETAKKKDDTPVFVLDGIAQDVKDWKEAKEQINIFEAQKKMAEGVLKEKGKAKFLELLATEGRRFTSFKITDIDPETGKQLEGITFGLQDRYTTFDEETAEKLEETFPGVVQSSKEYIFNQELLEKYMDQISEALMSLDIPDDAKANLLEVKEKFTAKKGTIDTLATYKERAPQLFEQIAPVAFMK